MKHQKMTIINCFGISNLRYNPIFDLSKFEIENCRSYHKYKRGYFRLNTYLSFFKLMKNFRSFTTLNHFINWVIALSGIVVTIFPPSDTRLEFGIIILILCLIIASTYVFDNLQKRAERERKDDQSEIYELRTKVDHSNNTINEFYESFESYKRVQSEIKTSVIPTLKDRALAMSADLHDFWLTAEKNINYNQKMPWEEGFDKHMAMRVSQSNYYRDIYEKRFTTKLLDLQAEFRQKGIVREMFEPYIISNVAGQATPRLANLIEEMAGQLKE
jgi:hypothetical protein